MSTNKHLIIQLLVQDMKHEQLLAGFSKLGFHNDMHGLDLSGVVSELMGIPKMQMSWDWFDVYMEFIDKAGQYELTGNGHNLLPLAETCYTFLCVCAEKEKSNNKPAEAEEEYS